MEGLGLRYDQEFLIAQLVRADRLHQLFRQSFSAVLGSYLGALILCWLGWDRFDHGLVIAWMTVMTLACSLRITMFVSYFRSPEEERTPQRWELRYWCTLMLSAGIWGMGALIIMPVGDLLAQTLVLLFAVGMSVSAVSCYSAYRNMTLASIALVLLPCTLWLLFQPTSLQFGLALATLVFSSFVVTATSILAKTMEKAFRLTHEMELAYSISALAAQTDELTGLKNRRAFFEHAQHLYSHCKTNRLVLCALMLDMDHFKQINDTYGHQVGDQVLRDIGEVISRSFREADIHGRLGGEEFAVLLPDTTLEVAHEIAHQLIASIAALKIEATHSISASLGVAATDADNNDLHSLMNSADKALYRAKASGRNQVVVAGRDASRAAPEASLTSGNG